MFTDTHAHIDVNDDAGLIIKNSINNGINKIIFNGFDRNSNIQVLDIKKKYSNVYAAIGIHPQNLNNIKEKDLKFIVDNINSIVAIGEIGLDYYNGHQNHELQKEIFEKQLSIAEKYNKPVIIHSREATQDTINILKKFPTVTGSIHCFTGSLETAKEYIKLGYALGINGVVTFKNSKLYQVVEKLSLDNILLETDSPYLTPEPYRGEKNEPANTLYIAKKICEIKNVPLEELSKITENTVKRIFDI